MKHKLSTAALLFLLCGTTAYADTIDEVIEALYNNGSIKEEDYNRLKNSRQEEVQTTAKKQEKTRKETVTGKVKDGAISFTSDDGSFSVTPSLRLQTDYRVFQGNVQDITANTFDIRRAGIGFKGTLYKNYEWLLVGAFGNGTGTLDDAYLNVNYWRQAQLRVGQFRVPFSLEDSTSDLYTDFIERSTGNVIAPGKERGLMLHGVPFKGATYALGLVTGQGRNANETVNSVDGNDVFAHTTFNLSEAFDWKNSVVHLGFGYTQGTEPVGAAVSGRTEARGLTFFSPAAFTGTEVDRMRTALHYAVAYGSFKVQGEFLQANYSGVNANGVGYDKDVSAQYISAMWLITGEMYSSTYKAGKFDRLKPNRDFDFKTFSGGAWEVGVRYSRFNGTDFDGGAVGTGVIPTPTSKTAFASAATSLTYGINFAPNSRTRLMLNYIDTSFNRSVRATQTTSSPSTGETKDEKAIVMRFQFDF